MTTAKEICETAANLVAGDRDRQHGDKVINFANIADFWDAYRGAKARSCAEATITPVDVANMMELLKIARTLSGHYNPDDYVDRCGYGGCAGELAEKANAPEV